MFNLVCNFCKGILTTLAIMVVLGFVGIVQLGFNCAKAANIPADVYEESSSECTENIDVNQILEDINNMEDINND